MLGLDRDGEALERAGRRLERFGNRVERAKANFAEMGRVARERGWGAFRGVLLDLGVSSMQLDEKERGFSFMADAPLDMRLDRDGGLTAAEWLEVTGEEEMARAFREYGEEKASHAVARAVGEARRAGKCPRTTVELAELVSRVKGGRRGRIHPATQVFQAVRIAVNGELDALRAGLDAALGLLEEGGRLAVISFHSLEDRIVKEFMAAHEGRMEALMAGGERWCGVEPRGRRVTHKPVVAGEEETSRNPRARSAKLRVFEKGISTQRCGGRESGREGFQRGGNGGRGERGEGDRFNAEARRRRGEERGGEDFQGGGNRVPMIGKSEESGFQ